MSKWGTVLADAVRQSAQPADMTILDKSGKVLIQTPLPSEFGGMPVLYSNRGLLQQSIHQYAISLGIKIRYGVRPIQVCSILWKIAWTHADMIFAGASSRPAMGRGQRSSRSGTGVPSSWTVMVTTRRISLTTSVHHSDLFVGSVNQSLSAIGEDVVTCQWHLRNV